MSHKKNGAKSGPPGGFYGRNVCRDSRDFLQKDPAQICMNWAAPVLLVLVWYWDVVKTGALALVRLQFVYANFGMPLESGSRGRAIP